MKKIIVGHFGAPFGVKGFLKVYSHTDPPENILKYLPWQIAPFATVSWRPIEIVETQKKGNQLLARIKDCMDCDQAKPYVNYEIAIEREQLPPLPSGEYYQTDLEGLRVSNTKGEMLGIVQQVAPTGSNDVLVIQGEKRHLVPFLIGQVILAIDIEKGEIIVEWDL